MIAAFGTLAFLVTMWLIVVVGAAVLEQSGGKIAAALTGRPAHQPAAVALRIRTRARVQQPMRALAEWRDAA
jgi:hypothetical protein